MHRQTFTMVRHQKSLISHMTKQRTKQNLIVVSVAVVIILCSVIATVQVSKRMASSGSEDKSYQNVTFTDAVLACEDEASLDFGAELSQLVVDRHSSRYDNDVFRYKIFLQAYTRKDDSEIAEFYITCYVKSSNGRISKFEVFENVETKEGEPIKQGGDKFIEWPQ